MNRHDRRALQAVKPETQPAQPIPLTPEEVEHLPAAFAEPRELKTTGFFWACPTCGIESNAVANQVSQALARDQGVVLTCGQCGVRYKLNRRILVMR